MGQGLAWTHHHMRHVHGYGRDGQEKTAEVGVPGPRMHRLQGTLWAQGLGSRAERTVSWGHSLTGN